MVSLGTRLQGRHSQDMSQGSRSGPEEEIWTPKIRTLDWRVMAGHKKIIRGLHTDNVHETFPGNLVV